jgi:hypothetical protein
MAESGVLSHGVGSRFDAVRGGPTHARGVVVGYPCPPCVANVRGGPRRWRCAAAAAAGPEPRRHVRCCRRCTALRLSVAGRANDTVEKHLPTSGPVVGCRETTVHVEFHEKRRPRIQEGYGKKSPAEKCADHLDPWPPACFWMGGMGEPGMACRVGWSSTEEGPWTIAITYGIREVTGWCVCVAVSKSRVAR